MDGAMEREWEMPSKEKNRPFLMFVWTDVLCIVLSSVGYVASRPTHTHTRISHPYFCFWRERAKLYSCAFVCVRVCERFFFSSFPFVDCVVLNFFFSSHFLLFLVSFRSLMVMSLSSAHIVDDREHGPYRSCEMESVRWMCSIYCCVYKSIVAIDCWTDGRARAGTEQKTTKH